MSSYDFFLCFCIWLPSGILYVIERARRKHAEHALNHVRLDTIKQLTAVGMLREPLTADDADEMCRRAIEYGGHH